MIIRLDLVDSALKLQTDNVYDRVPAEIRLNALAKIQDASGKLLREPDIAVTRQERLRIEPLQKNCEYIFEPFLSNAILEFAAKYAAETGRKRLRGPDRDCVSRRCPRRTPLSDEGIAATHPCFRMLVLRLPDFHLKRKFWMKTAI